MTDRPMPRTPDDALARAREYAENAEVWQDKLPEAAALHASLATMYASLATAMFAKRNG